MPTMTDVTAAIRAANELFEVRIQARDAAGIAALYTDDAILMPPNAPLLRGTEAIRAFFRRAIDEMPGRRIQLTTVELDSLGDTAIEVGTYQVVDGNRDVADEGKYIVVWKQRPGGDWRLHRDIFNSSRPAA